MPAIQADMKFASVPTIIGLQAQTGRDPICAMAPNATDAANLYGDGTQIRKAAKSERGDHK